MADPYKEALHGISALSGGSVPIEGAEKAEPQVTEVGDADRTLSLEKCYDVLTKGAMKSPLPMFHHRQQTLTCNVIYLSRLLGRWNKIIHIKNEAGTEYKS